MAKQEFSSNVIVANEYTLFGLSSVYGQMTVGTTAIEVKLGTSALSNRAICFIQAHPENTGYIYLGFDSTVSSTKTGFMLSAGQSAELTLNTTELVKIFAISNATGQKINVIEGKA